MQGDSHINKLKDFCKAALVTLELPADAEPNEEVVELIAEAISVFQAIMLLLSPAITKDTELAVIDDLKALSDAAERTSDNAVATLLGIAIKGKLSLAKTLDDLLKWQAEWKAHGASIQTHLAELSDIATVSKLLAAIPMAIETFEKYAVNLPQNATAELQDAIATATKRAAKIIIDDDAPEYTDVQAMSNLLLSCSRVAPLDAMINTMHGQLGDKLRQYNDDSKKVDMKRKVAIVMEKGFAHEAVLEAITSIEACRKVPPADFDAADAGALKASFTAGVDNLCAYSVQHFGGASKNEHHSLLQMLQAMVKYTGDEENCELIVEGLAAFMSMSTNLAAVKENIADADGDPVMKLNKLESHMRSLSRAIVKARSTMQACENAKVGFDIPKDLYEKCETTFNTTATQMLNDLKTKGAAAIADALKLRTTMTKKDGQDWATDAKEARKFDELAEIATSTILGDAKTQNDLQCQAKLMMTLKDEFKSLAASLQQSSAVWDELEQEVRATTLLLAEHRMLVCFTSATTTRGARRGVAKACQDELISRGFIVSALPAVLQTAMKAAIGVKPIA